VDLVGPACIPFPRIAQWVPEDPADASSTRLPLRGQRRNLTGFPYSRAIKRGITFRYEHDREQPSPGQALRVSKRVRCSTQNVDNLPGNQYQGHTMAHSIHLAAALEAAGAAADVVRHYYQSNLAITIKADRSPVTEADVETEKTIRGILAAKFPDHGFYGEETGTSALDAEYVWLVDPIDGTKAFVREYPMFSTQIALMHRGKLIVGVSSAPVYGELAYAEVGVGAWLNDAPIRVSTTSMVADAALSTGNLKTLATSSQWPAFGRLVGRLGRIRGYGDFLHYHLLASGRIDAVVESDVNVLDVGACAVIVEAAGGRFTDLDGGTFGIDGRTVLATNGRLHQPVLDALGA
jgi:histidinol-phosphatase